MFPFTFLPPKGVLRMYTSVVDLITKQGAARELTQAVNDKVRPLLEKQAGFVDVTVIVSDTHPNRVLALSFLNTRVDVQRYQREQFHAVHKTLQHILETSPALRTFA